MELYVNGKKIEFNFKYKIKESKEIKVKFIFNKNIIKNTSFMFLGCSSLKSIDLSSFNTSNVENMSCMFYKYSSLKSIYLSSFNASNVKYMSDMFYECYSLIKDNIKIIWNIKLLINLNI